MTTTKKQFEEFKEECERWYDKFRLDEWDVVYYHENMNSLHMVARINVILVGKSAAISFNKELIDDIKYNVEEVAKHEIIHLLLANLSELGWNRFTTESEIKTAEEALVRKLDKIIK